MTSPEQLTGEYVLRVRKQHKLSRDAFYAMCGFDGKSAARLANIEKKDSWKSGDRERVWRVLQQLGDDGPQETEERHLDVETHDVSDDDDDDSVIYCVASEPIDDDDDEPLTDASHDVVLQVEHILADEPASEFVYDLTHSEKRTFKRCRRKWWLGWYRNLTPRQEELLDKKSTGNRIHRALKDWYLPENEQRVDPRDTLERALVEDWTTIRQAAEARGHDDFVLEDLNDRFQKSAELERAMIEGYVEWLHDTGVDANLRSTHAETEMSATIGTYHSGDGNTYHVRALGKIDARTVRLSDGARFFVDHKTVGDLTSPVSTLPQNEQMLHYHLLEWLNTPEGEERCTGALYNMLRRVKRTQRAHPPFYDRVEVPHNRYEIESYQERLYGEAIDIIDTRSRLDSGASHQAVAYPNPTNDCKWDCEFFSVCSMFDDSASHVEFAVDSLFVRRDDDERYQEHRPGRNIHG